MKFGWNFGSIAAEFPVKFQSDWAIQDTKIAASRLREILR